MCIQTRSKQLTWHVFKVNVEFLSPVEDSLGANCQQKLRINWHSSICAVKLFLQTFISRKCPKSMLSKISVRQHWKTPWELVASPLES